MAKTTECDKLAEVSKKSQPIGEFLDWLQSEKNIVLCKLDEKTEEYWPESTDIEKLLAEYFGIDLNKVEVERRQILAEIRMTHDVEEQIG